MDNLKIVSSIIVASALLLSVTTASAKTGKPVGITPTLSSITVMHNG